MAVVETNAQDLKEALEIGCLRSSDKMRGLSHYWVLPRCSEIESDPGCALHAQQNC